MHEANELAGFLLSSRDKVFVLVDGIGHLSLSLVSVVEAHLAH